MLQILVCRGLLLFEPHHLKELYTHRKTAIILATVVLVCSPVAEHCPGEFLLGGALRVKASVRSALGRRTERGAKQVMAPGLGPCLLCMLNSHPHHRNSSS